MKTLNRDVLALSIFLVAMVVVEAQQQRQCCEDYCYDTDSEKPQTTHFGTKTAYEIIKGSNSKKQYVVPRKYSIKRLNTYRQKVLSAKYCIGVSCKQMSSDQY